MQQYMIDTNQISDTLIYLNDDDLHHIIKVMRMKIDDKIVCVDIETQLRYLCKIGKNHEILIEDIYNESKELPNNLVLAFGLVKSDKLEFVIQKACELGVTKFIPLIMQHSIVKIGEKKLEKKMQRWHKIIKEACEQAERNTLMEISMPIKVMDLVNEKQDINFLVYERADFNNKIRTKYQQNNDILLVIGPEGGFAQEEISFLNSIDFKQVSLGKRILRCETAAISAVSIVSDLME